MRKFLQNRILAATSVGLLLTLSNGAFAVTDRDTAAIEAAIPVPEPANVPPLTIDDVEAIDREGEGVDIKSLTGKELLKAPIERGLRGEHAALARELRQVLATRLGSIFDRKNERSAVEAFYRDRGFAPLWLSGSEPSARGRAAIAFLRDVAADGLDPADYPIPNLAGDAAALARAELLLTRAVFTFARHASTGRVAFTRVSGAILFHPQLPDPAQILSGVAAAPDAGATLDSYNPQQPGYKALKAMLAEKRGKPAVEEKVVVVPDGPTLRPGDNGERVVALRKRLKVGNQDSSQYDDDVVEAVKAFQKSAGLQPDGLVGPRTLATLNGRSPSQVNVVDKIIANMERWRWLPRQLGQAHVMVNIPDFTLRVVRNAKTVWQTKIVVGKPGNYATPLVSETMKFITVNPVWNVPPSIIRNEYLPVFEQDPQALERVGIKIEQNADGSVRMYQPPGPRNALGRIRFNFPNTFLVYQHDTPEKHLFERAERAYSHGCMRVQNPEQYAEVLLSISQPQDRITIDRLRRMYGDSERNITLDHKIPVHLTYQTAFVDDAGALQVRRDIYGHDETIINLMRGSDRRVADVPIYRDYKSSSKPVVAELPVEPQTFFSSFFGPRDPRAAQRDRRYGPRYEQNINGRYGRRDRSDRRYAGPDQEPNNFFEMLFR
jgi:murein L,D-transpeptidase YcbB/YkuD